MAAKKSRRSRGDGALFYCADRDRWMRRISVNGKPRTVSARNKSEARYKLDQLRRAADDGLPVITRDRTVAELLELWRTKALPNRDLSPARIASHDWAIGILTHELGGIKLQALTVDDIEAALTRRTTAADEQPTPRKGRGRTVTSALSRNSLIKLRSTLSQALTWAQRRDLVTRNDPKNRYQRRLCRPRGCRGSSALAGNVHAFQARDFGTSHRVRLMGILQCHLVGSAPHTSHDMWVSLGPVGCLAGGSIVGGS